MPRNLNPLFTLLPWFLVPSVPGSSFADDWGQLATISSTMGVQAGKICLGEASRGDIGCPTYAPNVSPNGDITTSGKFIGEGSTPSGAIMAFDLAACPTGWSEYTPARGRFLRGIDNGAGNDPSGTRVAGNTQDDLLKSHGHVISNGTTTLGYNIGSNAFQRIVNSGAADGTNTISAQPTGGAETRPKNVAVLFCRKN